MLLHEQQQEKQKQQRKEYYDNLEQQQITQRIEEKREYMEQVLTSGKAAKKPRRDVPTFQKLERVELPTESQATDIIEEEELLPLDEVEEMMFTMARSYTCG